jgi:hypothetical protein
MLLFSNQVLMKSNLWGVVVALDLSRVVFQRIKLNMLFSLGFNVLGIPIAAGALYPWLQLRLPPELAGLAMALSSVSVVTSSLLLRRYQAPQCPTTTTTTTIQDQQQPPTTTIPRASSSSSSSSSSAASLPFSFTPRLKSKNEKEEGEEAILRTENTGSSAGRGGEVELELTPSVAYGTFGLKEETQPAPFR